MIVPGRRLLGLLLLAAVAPALFAATGQPPDGGDRFSPVGSGRLTWWGFAVYDATLYAPDGSFRPEQPHTIEITYRVSFSRAQLAGSTVEEIERLRGGLPEREALLELFESIFPDVAAGDRIAALHHPGEGAEFFTNGRQSGRIDDGALAADFFAIWLDPASRKPDLRARLLGYRE